MSILNRVSRKVVKSASTAAKSEVKKTLLDLLPTIFGVISMGLGLLIFKGSTGSSSDMLPSVRTTNITTNNYFFGEMSEESIKRILDDQ